MNGPSWTPIHDRHHPEHCGVQGVDDLSAAGRIFTIVLVVGGVGVMFYSLGTIVQYLIEGQMTNILGDSPYERQHRQDSKTTSSSAATDRWEGRWP